MRGRESRPRGREPWELSGRVAGRWESGLHLRPWTVAPGWPCTSSRETVGVELGGLAQEPGAS